MKRIGLIVAAGLLGTTSVASAGIAVQQFSANTSVSTDSVKLDAKTEGLAAGCWIATAGAAGCRGSGARRPPR